MDNTTEQNEQELRNSLEKNAQNTLLSINSGNDQSYNRLGTASSHSSIDDNKRTDMNLSPWIHQPDNPSIKNSHKKTSNQNSQHNTVEKKKTKPANTKIPKDIIKSQESAKKSQQECFQDRERINQACDISNQYYFKKKRVSFPEIQLDSLEKFYYNSPFGFEIRAGKCKIRLNRSNILGKLPGGGGGFLYPLCTKNSSLDRTCSSIDGYSYNDPNDTIASDFVNKKIPVIDNDDISKYTDENLIQKSDVTQKPSTSANHRNIMERHSHDRPKYNDTKNSKRNVFTRGGITYKTNSTAKNYEVNLNGQLVPIKYQDQHNFLKESSPNHPAFSSSSNRWNHKPSKTNNNSYTAKNSKKVSHNNDQSLDILQKDIEIIAKGVDISEKDQYITFINNEPIFTTDSTETNSFYNVKLKYEDFKASRGDRTISQRPQKSHDSSMIDCHKTGAIHNTGGQTRPLNFQHRHAKSLSNNEYMIYKKDAVTEQYKIQPGDNKLKKIFIPKKMIAMNDNDLANKQIKLTDNTKVGMVNNNEINQILQIYKNKNINFSYRSNRNNAKNESIVTKFQNKVSLKQMIKKENDANNTTVHNFLKKYDKVCPKEINSDIHFMNGRIEELMGNNKNDSNHRSDQKFKPVVTDFGLSSDATPLKGQFQIDDEQITESFERQLRRKCPKTNFINKDLRYSDNEANNPFNKEEFTANI